MKKSILLVVMVLFSFNFIYGQWTISGTNIYNSNSGNVGIGKTSPSHKLDVNGVMQTTQLLITKPNDVSNWNNLWQSGFYDGFGAINSPETNAWFWGIHMGHGSNSSSYRYGGQIAIKNESSNPEMYFRATNESGTGVWRKVVYQSTNGNIGIGTTNPSVPLHVVSTKTINNDKVAAILGGGHDHWTCFGGAQGGRIRGSVEGYLLIESNPDGPGDKNLYLNFSSSGNVIIGRGGGNVGIGIDIPGTKLDVNGTVRAHEVRVCLNQGCDFVFEPDYKLMPLNELDAFITTNKHLPEVAPAAVMESEGINLSEMNAKLLQKVEEQTLYIIDLNKRLIELENKIK